MIVGIDLGTTHSLAGVFDSSGARLVPNALGETLTPSVVSVDETGTVIVGRAALERLVTHPELTVSEFKRWMGTNRVTRLGGHAFRPEELSALILRSLLADVEAATGDRVSEAVISVPAYFSDSQRKATRTAGELAGIKVERLINEPTAAALAYGLERRNEGRYLVFDLGGGTFDVSVLEMFEGVMEVHASAGDNHLGGKDFTHRLRELFMEDVPVRKDYIESKEIALLGKKLEQLKLRLGNAGTSSLEITLAGREHAWSIDEARFAERCDDLVQRMRIPVERAMRDARLAPSQLDEIVLVGGASRMPLCARLVSRMFGRLPLRHVNPDETIAIGACVAAGLKQRDQALEEIVLTDICPYTLGVEVAEHGESGLFSPVINRNSTVPVSRMNTYVPTGDNQPVVDLKVFQGESPYVVNNVLLGNLRVDLPPGTREQNLVDVRFTYDINGLLQVEATVRSSGITRELILEQNPGVLSQEEIASKLAALQELKVHPREQQENIALMARAERLYEELLWARPQLQQALSQFRALLDRQEVREIAEQRQLFARFLDQVEASDGV